MLRGSLIAFCATVLLGLVLIMLHALRRWRVVNWVGPLHAALGCAGLSLLIISVETAPPRGMAEGVGAFGSTAAVILGLALLAGLSLWRGRNSRQGDPTLLIGIHASLAIFGVAILAAYFAAPS